MLGERISRQRRQQTLDVLPVRITHLVRMFVCTKLLASGPFAPYLARGKEKGWGGAEGAQPVDQPQVGKDMRVDSIS